jgi:predicted aspartyl protease
MDLASIQVSSQCRVGALCLAISFASVFSHCAHATETAAPAETAKCRYVTLATVPLSLNDLMQSIDGTVNHDKINMLVDSGAQNTLLTQAEMTKLGLSQQAPASKRAKSASDDKVQLDELSIGPIEIGSTHIMALQSATDQANYGALVGADFLFQHDFELSLAAQKINFFKPNGCDSAFLAYWDKNASTVALTKLSATDQRQVVTVEINGEKMRALIDTAAPMSVINLAAAARAGITPKSPGVTPLNQPGRNGTQVAKTWIAKFDRFTIGDETINNVKIPILDLRKVVNTETPRTAPDMLLGADFLRAHHVLFAVSQHQFYFSYLGGSVFRADTLAQAASDTLPK